MTRTGRRRRSPRARTPASSSAAAEGAPGETYVLRGERVAIGRHPDAAIFLDDVTVSRNHAAVVREEAAGPRRRGQPRRHLHQSAPRGSHGPHRWRRDPDRQVQARLPRCGGDLTSAGGRGVADYRGTAVRCRRRAPAHHRLSGRPLARRVPGHQRQQAPLPRGAGPGHAAPHQVRLRLYSQDDYAAGARARHAAERVPASQGHPPRARTQGPQASASIGANRACASRIC